MKGKNCCVISSTDMMNAAPDDIELGTEETTRCAWQFANLYCINCCHR